MAWNRIKHYVTILSFLELKGKFYKYNKDDFINATNWMFLPKVIPNIHAEFSWYYLKVTNNIHFRKAIYRKKDKIISLGVQWQ